MNKKDELLPILESLLGYGRIHTVSGIVYPDGSHQEILDRLESYLNTEYKMNKSEIECEQLREDKVNSPIGEISVIMAKSPHNNENNSDMSAYKHFIKFNSQSHITFHKVEEKMYTRDEIKSIMRQFYRQDRETIGTYFCDEWFEQNVK